LDRRRWRARAPQPAGDPAVHRADAQRVQPRARRVLAHARKHGRPDLRPDRRAVPAAAADRRRRADGAAGLSVQTYGWLVLAFPLGGAVLMSLLFRVLPGKVPGIIGTLAIALSFASA